MELTIFDDSQPMNGKEDLVGTARYFFIARVNLKGLIDNEIINVKPVAVWYTNMEFNIMTIRVYIKMHCLTKRDMM